MFFELIIGILMSSLYTLAIVEENREPLYVVRDESLLLKTVDAFCSPILDRLHIGTKLEWPMTRIS